MIVPVTTPEQLGQVRQLLEEYAASLSFSLAFQNFQAELDNLPDGYVPPTDNLWLATADSGEASGCVALRFLEPNVGEMKRLFVRPEFRGMGLGKRLAITVLEAATDMGYRKIRLDTAPELAAAIRLYDSLGFIRIPLFRYNPIEGALAMEIDLTHKESAES